MLRKVLSASMIFLASVSVSNAGETEAFLGGLATGVAIGAVIDSPYRPIVDPVPYNNYGNLNYPIYPRRAYSYEYDDPTSYRPVCMERAVEIYGDDGNIVIDTVTDCSMQQVR